MGLIDAIDNALAGAKARRIDRREVARFARKVRPGRTYYSVQTFIAPWGEDMQLAFPHRFPDRFLGLPSNGPHTVATVWAQCGPLYERPPARVQTLDDYLASGDDGELVKPTTKREREKAVAKIARKLPAAA